MHGFRLDAHDEYVHPLEESPHFNESVYVNAADPSAPFGGWMRLGNRPREGYAELSVCLYLPDGRIACQFQRPAIDTNERFDAGGMRYEVVQPFRTVRITYEGDLMLLENGNPLREPRRMFDTATRVPGAVRWEVFGTSPMHGGEPTTNDVETMYGRDFSRGHFNQHTRVIGSVRIGEMERGLRGYGWRDHSWGPRLWQAIHFYRLFVASFEDGRGFMLLKITDRAGRTRRLGVLLVDGEYEDVLDLDLVTEWSPELDPAKVRLAVRTARRAELITGEIVTLAPLRNRRNIGGETVVSRIAEGFTRFTWNGAVTHGMTEYVERIENDRPVGFPT